MKRPLRNRTMGAVREGRGNPSPLLDLETAKTQYTEKQKGAEEAPAQEPQSPSAVTVTKFSNS